MTDIERTGVDVSFEHKVAAEGPGVRQRALAIQALQNVSELFGTTPTEAQVEAIRTLSKQEAKAARQALEATVTLLGQAGVVEVSQNEHEAIIDEPIDAALITPIEAVTSKPAQPEPEPEPEVESEPEPEPELKPEIEPEVEEAIEKDSDEPSPLSGEIVKWLDGLIDRDPAALTTADIPSIIIELNEAYGPYGTRKKLDYNLLLQLRLEGKSYKIIHESFELSTVLSLKQALVNFRKRVLTNKAIPPAAEDDTREVPVVQSVRPVPRPPASTTVLQKIETSKETETTPLQPEIVVEVDFQEGDEPNLDEIRESQLNELTQAAENSNIYSNAEWKEIAEEYLYDVAAKLLSPEEIEALWGYLHIEDDGEHRSATTKYQSALNKLRANFTELAHRSNKDSLEQQALRMLFNISMGYKDLYFIQRRLSEKDSSVTLSRTQRIVVAGIARVVKGND